jgi:hypothetical protein
MGTIMSKFSKIFESVMAKRLNSFCEKYNIYNESQQRSTVSALYKFTHEILNKIDSKKHAIAMLFDMSKAYDRVSHKILLEKLHGIGVRGITYQWFVSYLESRQQYVDIEYYDYSEKIFRTYRLEKVNVKYSIPQESVLGCILFLLYVNDLPKNLDNKCILYADDITVIFQCDNSEQLKQQLNTCFVQILEWLNDHNLCLNVSKTKLIQIKPRQKVPIDTTYSYKNC